MRDAKTKSPPEQKEFIEMVKTTEDGKEIWVAKIKENEDGKL